MTFFPCAENQESRHSVQNPFSQGVMAKMLHNATFLGSGKWCSCDGYRLQITLLVYFINVCNIRNKCSLGNRSYCCKRGCAETADVAFSRSNRLSDSSCRLNGPRGQRIVADRRQCDVEHPVTEVPADSFPPFLASVGTSLASPIYVEISGSALPIWPQ